MVLTQCRNCQLVFQNPLLPEFAGGDYYEGDGAQFYLSPDKLRSDHAPVRYERELALLRRYCPAGRILDVGCGTGGFLHQLRQRFGPSYETVGNDIAGPAVDYAQSLGIQIHRGPLSELAAQPAFDIITFWAVLEHLPTPHAFLSEAARLLRPGGICVALTPNHHSLAVRVLGSKYRYILPQHVNYFTSRTLQELFARTQQFQPLVVHSTHFNPVVIVRDFLGRGQAVPDAQRAQLLTRTNALKQNPWLKPLRWTYRYVESALGFCHLADNVVVVQQRRP